jgi:transcription elongation factor GreA
MRVPIRKGGQYTHLKPDNNITQDKYDEMKANLERLVKVVRPRAAEEVKRLAEFGDFSENAEYQIAKGKLRGINQRILELEDHIGHAIIILPNKNSHTVQLGSLVTVEIGGKQRTFQILGSSQTDPGSGVISHKSPIGLALMGAEVGETVTVKLANKNVDYKIISIE